MTAIATIRLALRPSSEKPPMKVLVDSDQVAVRDGNAMGVRER